MKKSLSPMLAWAIAFGCIIGRGSFINHGKEILPNSGVAGTAIAMGLGVIFYFKQRKHFLTSKLY